MDIIKKKQLQLLEIKEEIISQQDLSVKLGILKTSNMNF